jgi:hypothetical protein
MSCAQRHLRGLNDLPTLVVDGVQRGEGNLTVVLEQLPQVVEVYFDSPKSAARVGILNAE